jgi:hypothetical protein
MDASRAIICLQTSCRAGGDSAQRGSRRLPPRGYVVDKQTGSPSIDAVVIDSEETDVHERAEQLSADLRGQTGEFGGFRERHPDVRDP